MLGFSAISELAISETGVAAEIPVNPTPSAADDSFPDISRATGAFTDFDVLLNDTFIDTPAIRITDQSGPGTATVAGSGRSSRIRVPRDTAGLKALVYSLTASGNSGADSAAMSVTIVAPQPEVLPPPAAIDDDFADITQGAGLTTDFNVLLNDVYAGTPTIVITSQAGPGTATVFGSGTSSRIRVPRDTAGIKAVTYSLSAGQNTGSDSATMLVEIVAAAPAFPPVAEDDTFPDIIQGAGSTTDLPVLANDRFSGTPAITIASQSGPGTATIFGSGAASRIRVPRDEVGTKSVTYSLIAGGNAGSAQATMTVNIVASGGTTGGGGGGGGGGPVIPEAASPDDPPKLQDPPVTLPTVKMRFASHSFVTRSSDSPANQFVPGRLNRGLVVGRRISNGPQNELGSLVVSSYGEIEIANTDGGLDFLADDYFVDGRPITIKMGRTQIDAKGREVVWPLAAFQTVYTAVAGSWSIERDALRLRVRDRGINLQRQLQTAVYGGNGGQQGTLDMKGRTVPVCLGRCMNISAQQVDPVKLTYQVHDSTVSAITQVYDAGAVVPFDADYPNYPTLAVATIPAGKHSTSLAAGCFRLGTDPFGTVTADVDGDATGASFVATHSNVIRRILTRYSWLDDDDIDHASFDAYYNIQTHVMGIYLPAGDTSTLEQVIERVALSGGAVAGQDRSGRYRVIRLSVPSSSPIKTFTDRNILEIERQPLPWGVPWQSWTAEGARNWTVQTGGDVVGSVNQTRRRFLEAEVRSQAVDVPNVANAHPTAGSATRSSLFHFMSNAGDEAIRLATLYKLGRAAYRLTVKDTLFAMDIGDTIQIQYQRWNLAEGRNFVITAISEDVNTMTTELEVFG